AELQASPVDILVGRRHPEYLLDTSGGSIDAAEHPLQHAHVLAKPGPHELAVGALAEPVDAINARQYGARILQALAKLQPMTEIVAHVVAAERQHGERSEERRVGKEGRN